MHVRWTRGVKSMVRRFHLGSRDSCCARRTGCCTHPRRHTHGVTLASPWRASRVQGCVRSRIDTMAGTAFVSSPLLPSTSRVSRRVSYAMCSARPPNDPTNLRTESQRRRNSPPKPMRRRRRRQEDDDPVDWDKLESIPLVRRDASPESGEDYWVEASVTLSDATGERRKPPAIEGRLKQKLRDEVVRPYAQNWILWISLGVLALVLAVWAVGGVDTLPIISVPDL
ncbi:hypothetical protein FGB62_6g153 [Gracilaria domingensis]|nr:hypothetical protein FGB62_6g153 [Gracilaria domingensis]